MTSKRTLIKGGTVLTLDGDQGASVRADVVIEGQRIEAIAPTIEAADSEIVDATNMLVVPGLVDAHRHTWQGLLKHIAPDADLNTYLGTVLAGFAPVFRPQDVYVGTLLGALEALDAGITTLFDWSHIQHTPEHTDAAVAGLQEAGLRAVFGYGFPTTSTHWFYESTLPHPADARRVRDQYFASNDQLVTMALAVRGPELTSMEVTRHDWALARELGLPLSVHVGNGALGARYRAIEQLDAAGLLGPDTQYVHTVSLADAALARIHDSGGTAVVTPAVELQMGFGMPATGRLIAHGIRPGLGVDVVTSTAGDLFTQMRSAYGIERALAAQEPGSRPLLTSRDLLRLATIDGARAVWLDGLVGTITPGKQADLILIRTDRLHLTPVNDPVGAVTLSAHAGDVDTVFMAGTLLKHHGVLVGVDMRRIKHLVEESHAYLVQATARA